MKTIRIYLDNAQSQPKLRIMIDDIVNENLPTNSILTTIFPEIDDILLWEDVSNRKTENDATTSVTTPPTL